MNKIFLSFPFLLLFFTSKLLAQLPKEDETLRNLFTEPLNYIIYHTSEAPTIDGKLDDSVWAKASWTEYFQDIEGDLKPKPYYKTRAKMVWDGTYIYIAAEMEDEHVWANLTERDQIVFFDNDFEVFIDPETTTHRYFEYEVNAMNTIFDLFLSKPYRTGSGALISWDSNGLKHAVQVYGTLNNPRDKDKGWTVEMAIPFKDITIGNNPRVPKDGDIWRLNFSRVQWDTEIVDGKYQKKRNLSGKNLPERNWVWSPQGIIDMHAPERWGYIQFSAKEAGSDLIRFQLPYVELQKKYLWLIYYKQQEYRKTHGKYALSLDQLGVIDKPEIAGIQNRITIEASSSQFSVFISDNKSRVVSLNQEGYLQ